MNYPFTLGILLYIMHQGIQFQTNLYLFIQDQHYEVSIHTKNLTLYFTSRNSVSNKPTPITLKGTEYESALLFDFWMRHISWYRPCGVLSQNILWCDQYWYDKQCRKNAKWTVRNILSWFPCPWCPCIKHRCLFVFPTKLAGTTSSEFKSRWSLDMQTTIAILRLWDTPIPADGATNKVLNCLQPRLRK